MRDAKMTEELNSGEFFGGNSVITRVALDLENDGVRIFLQQTASSTL